MAGKRQPTDVIVANGRKHLSRAEEDDRRDREVHVPPAEALTPPKWLAKKHHAEYFDIAGILNQAGLFSDLDRDVLAQYFVCRDGWIKAEKQAAKAIRTKDADDAKTWAGIQGTYFKQARQCAEAMGLSVTSRCRIVVPAALVTAASAQGDDTEDEFTAILHDRQRRAMGG
jgi:P27 family predicted phage terminase small subunit